MPAYSGQPAMSSSCVPWASMRPSRTPTILSASTMVDRRLGAVVIATIALFLLINSAMQRSARALSGQRMAAQSAIVGAVLEYVQGMGVVRAFSMTGDAERKLSGAIAECERMNVSFEFKFIRFAVLQTVLTKTSSVLMCLVCVLSLIHI